MSNLADEIKFDSNGLVPVIAQDSETNEVLMLAYMNRETLEKSMETGLAHYWSRSRNKIWLKGETSGHYQKIKSIKTDCDSDALLILVEQVEAACHTGHHSCFFKEYDGTALNEASQVVFDPDQVYGKAKILKEVYDIIADRKLNPKEGSYTNYLFTKGLDKILKKVGEEASEVIIAAKNRSNDETRYEIADLFYHIMVLMVDCGLKLDDIYGELQVRR